MSDVPVSAVTIPRVAAHPSGVGGWLLVFVISFSVVSPAFMIGNSLRLLSAAASLHRTSVVAVYQFAGWSEILIGLLFVAVGMLIVCRKRQAKAAVPLVLAFCTLWGITLWSLFVFLPADAPVRALWEERMMFPMLQRFVYAVLWGSYWMHSTRVANTFAEEA